jgi:predicted nucleic acid-binding protein
VVGANVLFSALLRNGATRHVLVSSGLNLHTPAVLWGEVERNRPYLLRKSGATEAAFDLLVGLLRSKINDVPDEVVASKLAEALRRLAAADRLDAPYAAAALAIGAALWTHDERLAKGAGVSTVTTADVLKQLEE